MSAADVMVIPNDVVDLLNKSDGMHYGGIAREEDPDELFGGRPNDPSNPYKEACTQEERITSLQAYTVKLERQIRALEASRNDDRTKLNGEVAGELVTLRTTVKELNEALKLSTEKDKEWRNHYNHKVSELGSLKELVKLQNNAIKSVNRTLELHLASVPD